MGLRLIFIGLAIWVLVAIVRHLYRQRAESTTPRSLAAQDMVRCARCGVHLPKSDALPAGGEYFCCEQHRPEGGQQGKGVDAGNSGQ